MFEYERTRKKGYFVQYDLSITDMFIGEIYSFVFYSEEKKNEFARIVRQYLEKVVRT